MTADVEDPPSPTFSYSPRHFASRLLVSVRLKSKLESSRVLRIPYRHSVKYLLIVLLILVGAFLTPQLLPKWLGFEWASPSDLCQTPESKIAALRTKIVEDARLSSAHNFLSTQNHTLSCMRSAAERFYHGPTGSPPRFLWPDECDSEKAQISLTETTCVQQDADVCDAVGGVFGFLMGIGGDCVRDVGPEVCTESTDANRSQALLELEQDRRLTEINETVPTQQVEDTAASANQRVQDIVSRLITQVDVAADAFIVYSLLSIAIGIPLIISKREKTSRFIGATLGLTKIWFIVVFVVIISVYDSINSILKETDFPRLYQNFMNDPCYVDPKFSAKRIEAIVEVCNNVSYVDAQSEIILQHMDSTYYNVRLFGFCKDETRNLSVHPRLDAMEKIRVAYRNKTISNPGHCNATELDEVTSVAPRSDRVSRWKALLGSGVLAQLALKILATSWILSLFGYIEPMVMHNGKVEVWGARGQQSLSKKETEAICRFARDKHLLSLLILSFLMVIEVALIIYSIAVTLRGGDELPVEQGVFTSPPKNLTCPTSLLPL